MMRLFALVLLGVAFSVSAAAMAEKTEKPAAPAQEVAAVAGDDMLVMPHAEDRVLGNPFAKVQIVEYASYTCPHCATFHKEVMPDIQKKLIDTGKARFVFRPFPLDNVAFAISKLTYCAPKKNYYDMVHAYMDEQAVWTKSKDLLGSIKEIAARYGLDESAVDACLLNEEVHEVVKEFTETGQKLGVNSTPSIFVDGKLLPGIQRIDVLEKLVDEALAE